MAESLAIKKTSTEDTKNSTENSDFIIKVEDVSYPVHQNILISSSEYFRGMLAHDMKERQDGFVEIKEIDSKTMKLCINFMYDRDIDVTMVTAKTLLPASEFLQLTELSKRCVDVLKDNLYSGNCISVLKLARAYNSQRLAETALRIFRERFPNVNFEDFCKLDKEGLIKQHISDRDMEKAWDAIINWIKLDVENRSSDIVELVETMNWKIFPSSCFLQSVWSEPLFKSSEFCKNLVYKNLFLSNETLKKELNTKNCLIICKIATDFVFLSEDAMKIILNYIAMNLAIYVDREEFKSLSKEFISDLLTLGDVGLCDDTLRWKVAKHLIKHNPELKDSLKCIRFDQMPKKFIKSTVLSDPLLDKSQKNILQCMLKTSNDETYIAVMYSDGVILAWNISDKTWYRTPNCPRKGVTSSTRMFSFHDKLCILVDGELFYLGKNKTKWISRATLKHRLDQFFAVVSSDDRIYVVEKERMSRYNPDANTWSESLPGCGLNGKIFAGCTSDVICVRNTLVQESTYSIRKEEWSPIVSASKISPNGDMATHCENIFVTGICDRQDRRNIAECYYNGWKPISNTPVAMNKQCHLFFVDERLFLLVSGTLYHYVDLVCDKWVEYCSFPKFTNLEIFKNFDPVSVCSFKGNLKIAQIE